MSEDTPRAHHFPERRGKSLFSFSGTARNRVVFPVGKENQHAAPRRIAVGGGLEQFYRLLQSHPVVGLLPTLDGRLGDHTLFQWQFG